jgi:membrane protein DedA with SNARE-associated domain
MHAVAHLIHTYGLLVVAGFIGLESIGLPLPGETALIVGSVIAGRTHELNIIEVIVTATCASFFGRILGYMIGAKFGYWLLLRYGAYVRITEPRIKLGQYLFLQHGAMIMIVAQFVPVMRAIAGVLAGGIICLPASWVRLSGRSFSALPPTRLAASSRIWQTPGGCCPAGAGGSFLALSQ